MNFHSLRFKGVEKYDSIPDEAIVDLIEPSFKPLTKMWVVKVKLDIPYGRKKPNTFIPFTAKNQKRSMNIYRILKAKKGRADISRKIAELQRNKKWNHQMRQKIEEIGMVNQSRYENAKVVLKQTDTNRFQKFWAKVNH